MKNLFNRSVDGPFKTLMNKEQNCNTRIPQPFFYLTILFAIFLFTACKKYAADKTESNNEEKLALNEGTKINGELIANYKGLDPQTLSELQQAHSATAKYQNINNAFADNYGDIPIVVMPNMGYHFLKAGFISPVFDFRKPAILVYNKKKNGEFELVALEYAVPIDPQSPNIPPEGFSGNDDLWDFNTLNSGWWTLHAWVWKNNPDGVFKPFNPLVILQ